MDIQLLETKFHIPPTRPEHVGRHRLVAQLDEGFHRKLTLVSAPAGFGKTTLISEWIDKCESRACWLSLDRGDNDPTRFLNYLIGALQTAHDGIGQGAQRLLHSSQPSSPGTILTSLINDIVSASERLILVLDDYHTIENTEIDDILNFLIGHMPVQMHLVVSTRENPQLSVARLRASGQMTELRAADLRFFTSEVGTFLNEGMGLSLSDQHITSLEKRTEGWIASLQLAALSMQKQDDPGDFIESFAGSHRSVIDYLVEEVLRYQSEDTQSFLVKTSILDRMCGSLCNELTGIENGQETLETLDASNLFIFPLDNQRRWYRYHHLFADLLRQRLLEMQPEDIAAFHEKAGKWYGRNGFDFEAIEHTLRAGDYDYSGRLIDEYFSDNYERASQATRQRWLAEFPEGSTITKPGLALIEAWTNLVGGQLDAAVQYLEAVEKAQTGKDDQEAGDRRTQHLARAATLRSLIAAHTGQQSKCIQYGVQALELLREEDSSWRCVVFITLADAYAAEGRMEEAHQARAKALSAGKASNDVFAHIVINLRTAEILRQQGKLHQTMDICQRMLREAENGGIADTALVGWLLGIYGEVLVELNDIDRALESAKDGAGRAAQDDDVYYISYSNLYLVRVLFSLGDLAGAKEVIQYLERVTDGLEVPFTAAHQFLAWKARISLAEGRLELANLWAAEQDFDYDEESSLRHDFEYLVLARIFIAQERFDEANQLLQWSYPLLEKDNRVAREIESLSLQALALYKAGNIEGALVPLKRALSMAEPEGFVRLFVDEGPSMAALLYEAAKGDISTGYIRRLLSAFQVIDQAPKEGQGSSSSHPELVEGLSEREMEVLELIAEGMSNEQIGAKLFISIHTVKAHTRSIYAKLDCHSRTEAVARARYFGILTVN